MQDISYYTLGDILDTAEFARRGRKRGSRDKMPRRKRRMLAGGIAGAGVLGGAGGTYGARLGMAGRSGMRANTAIANRTGLSKMFGPKAVSGRQAFRAGAIGQAGADLAAVKMGATKGARGIGARTSKAIGTIPNSARSVGGLLKGRKGLALAGAGAIAATAAGGIYASGRRRR